MMNRDGRDAAAPFSRLMSTGFWLKGARGAAISMAVSGMVLSGCVATAGNVDPTDPCGVQRAELEQSQDFFAGAIIKGALIGAAVGALGGLLAGGDAKSAAIGAGVGALAGGVGGYFEAKQKDTQDRQALAQSVFADVERENGEIDRATLTFLNVKECRFRVAEQTKDAFKRGTLPRDQAQARLARMSSKFNEEIAIAEQLGAKMSEREKEFRVASEQLVQEDPRAQALLAQRQQAAASFAPPPPPRPGPRQQQVQPRHQGAGKVYSVRTTTNIRSAPSIEGEVVGQATRGDKFTGYDVPAVNWVSLTLNNGTIGFIYKPLLIDPNAPRVSQPAPRPQQQQQQPQQQQQQATAPATGGVDLDLGKPQISAAEQANPTAKVAIMTTSNVEKRAAYESEVAQARQQSQVAFDLDKQSNDLLSRLFAPMVEVAMLPDAR